MQRYALPEPMSGCWLWTGTTNGQHGYGLISLNGGQEYAHRVSFEMHRGPIQHGTQVLHSCDNSFCVNPDHLYLGTQADNMRDMRIRNRAKKLTPQDVVEIRRSSLPYTELAAIYKVGKSTICNVRKGRFYD